MRALLKSPVKSGVAAVLGALLGVLSFGDARAANPLELNFWLSGPRYDGKVKPCEYALPTITSQFRDKETAFWNSSLAITGYGNIRETAFRPWQSDNIPRRYCSGEAMLSDGKVRREPAKPTSVWAFKRTDPPAAVYTAPNTKKTTTQTFTVKGYGAPPENDPKAILGAAIPGAETSIEVVPNAEGKAKVGRRDFLRHWPRCASRCRRPGLAAGSRRGK